MVYNGIYTNLGDILMVNVTIYGIHGSYGIYYLHLIADIAGVVLMVTC